MYFHWSPVNSNTVSRSSWEVSLFSTVSFVQCAQRSENEYDAQYASCILLYEGMEPLPLFAFWLFFLDMYQRALISPEKLILVYTFD